MKGNLIRARREAAGLTQAEVAERAGLHVITMSRLENDQANPTLQTLQRLATALGCTVSDLLGTKPRRGAA